MLDVNSALITAVGVLSGVNTYWIKSWKDSVDKRFDKIDDTLKEHGERIAKIEGRMNGKVSL